MATVAEVKAANKKDLEKLLVEAGLDPAEYKDNDARKAALLPLASDAEQADVEDEGDGDENDEQVQEDTEVVDDAETAADAAQKPTKTEKVRVPAGHAGKFDENGQPVFGKA